MNGAATMALSEYEAAQSPWIVGILFYHLTCLNNCSHLDWSDHSLWSSHLPQCVREEEKPLRRSTSDSIPDQAIPPFSDQYTTPTQPMRQLSNFTPTDAPGAGVAVGVVCEVQP